MNELKKLFFVTTVLIIIIMKKFNVSSNRNLKVATILFTVLIIAMSCSKSTAYNTPTGAGGTGGTGGTGTPGANEVFIQGMAFNPVSISVAAGTTITWTNKDAIAHTVTSSTNLFDSGSLSSGGTYTFTFANAGTYSYYCSFHPSMVAKVIVTQ